MNALAALAEQVHEEAADVRQVAVVMARAHVKGRDFEDAWYAALRSLVVDEDVSPQAKIEEIETKAVLAETKAYWRAAFERRLPTREEVAAAMRAATARLHDLIEFDEAAQNGNGASVNGHRR